METYINIGKSILSDYFDFYCQQSLDDAEYIPVVRVIIEGILKAMISVNINKEDINTVEEELIEHNRALYINLWLEHTKEDEDNLDIEDETKSAKYYFDYIYEHGEHPH